MCCWNFVAWFETTGLTPTAFFSFFLFFLKLATTIESWKVCLIIKVGSLELESRIGFRSAVPGSVSQFTRLINKNGQF